MPATETTWRDQKLMHRIFAVTGVLLVVSTVWMLYADHARSWKTYQIKATDIDLKMIRLRQGQYETTDAVLEHQAAAQELATAESQPVDTRALASFKDNAVKLNAALDRYSWYGYGPVSFDPGRIDALAARLQELSEKAQRQRAEAVEAINAAEQAADDRRQTLEKDARDADREATRAEQAAGAVRRQLIERLQKVVDAARTQEDKALGVRKFRAADIDKAKADIDIAVRDNLAPEIRAAREQTVRDLVGGPGDADDKRKTFAAYNEIYQSIGTARRDLEKELRAMTADVDAKRKALDDTRADLERLQTQYAEREETYVRWTGPWGFNFIPLPGKKLLTFPILDAFNSPRNIETIWSDGLEQTYGSFGNVRRFDRCTTCHQAMVRTLPGQPTTPAYIHEEAFEMVLTPPPSDSPPKPRRDASGNILPLQLQDWLGVTLAREGLLNRDDVTVALVQPNSPAARASLVPDLPPRQMQIGGEIREAVAQVVSPPGEGENLYPKLPGLLVGDVIAGINGEQLHGGDRTPARVEAMLTVLAQEGRPIRLTVRRGLPNPYISHPRLDLFVSDSSPHSMQTFGCTICHEGQGSATDFKWASHTPNTMRDMRRWTDEHGWFDNHHWIFPMYPRRFAESSCLKCHHQVVQLETSDRFPDAPAPKLTHGFHLIRKYGCYGCHEINGFDGQRPIGPDMRTEPNYFAAAQQIRAELNRAERQTPDAGEIAPFREQIDPLIDRVVAHPEDAAIRTRLRSVIEQSVATGSEATPLDRSLTSLANLLRDVDMPGDQRRPGPSLRFVNQKLDPVFLYDWLNDPRHFRPDTRMPKFFGLWEHLKPTHQIRVRKAAEQLQLVLTDAPLRELAARVAEHPENDADRHALANGVRALPRNQTNLNEIARLDALADQLIEPAEVLEPVEIRGLVQYLASYGDDQRLELELRPSGIDAWGDDERIARGKIQFQTRGCLACHTHKDFPDVAKYRSPDEIVQGPDLSAVGDKFRPDRNPAGPDWLYSWIKNPTKYHARTVMPDLFLDPEQDVEGRWFDPADDIAAYLLTSTSEWQPVRQAQQVMQPWADEASLKQLTLEYLKEAFFEEDAKEYYLNGIPPELEGELKGAEKDLIVPESESLTDAQRLKYIGRKTIAKYGCFGCHDIPGFEDAKPIGTGLADWGRKDPARLAFEHIAHYVEHGHGHAAHGSHHGVSPSHVAGDAGGDHETEELRDYYTHALEAGNRIGFIYQKLKEPRSYDYEKTESRRYNERLRMPQFPFNAEEREAIITFVLGLVADPPQPKYVFTPDERSKALLAGRQVLEKYNCGGCHILSLEKWKIRYSPESFGPQTTANVYPFLQPHFQPADLAAAATPDRRNELQATLLGLPPLNQIDGLPLVQDLDGLALENDAEYGLHELRFALDLYQPAILDGHPYITGQSPISFATQEVEARYPTWGGTLTKYLLPVVTQLERQVNPNASGAEAYGWLPPPLIGQGNKVQTSWLHDFLLEPYAIRPAAFLRMPKFNMSSAEASALANYFAAVDDVEYPYSYSAARDTSRLLALESDYRQRREPGSQSGSGTIHAQPADGGQPQSGGQAAAGGTTPSSSTAAVEPSTELARMDDAMRIIVNGNYCVKCHIVSDFVPPGSPRAKAPNLAEVYRRLRPEYLRDWIANPKSILPYTSMPVNIPYDPNAPNLGGVSQDLYHGTSIEQVEGLVDLLMNYDRYTRQSTRVADMVVPAPAEGTPAEAAPPVGGASSQGTSSQGTSSQEN